MSGEYEDSSRNVAKGFRIALPLIALSYVLPTLACLAAYPAGSWTQWGIDGGFSSDVLGYGTIFSTVLGHSGVVLFLVIAIMSQCTIYNTYLASGSRSFWVLSEDNLFPRFIRKVDRAGRSPYIGVLTIAVSSLIFSQFDFTTIIEMNIIFILARYMFLGFIVLKLRKMYPVQDRPADMFVIGGGKVGVVVYSALAFIIATFTLCLNPVQNFFFTAAFLASGVVAYIIFKKIYGGLTVENPVAYPQDPRTGLAVGDTRRIGAVRPHHCRPICAESADQPAVFRVESKKRDRPRRLLDGDQREHLGVGLGGDGSAGVQKGEFHDEAEARQTRAACANETHHGRRGAARGHQIVHNEHHVVGR